MNLKLWPAIKKCLYQIDFFKQRSYLRAQGEGETSRICTGVFTFLLFIFFLYVFIQNMQQLLNYGSISFSQVFEIQENQTQVYTQNILFAVIPSFINHASWKEYFDIEISIVTRNKIDNKTYVASQTKLDIQNCRRQRWENHTEIFQSYYLDLNMCLRDYEGIGIKGSYNENSYFHIKFIRCSSTDNSTCHNDDFFQKWLLAQYYQFTSGKIYVVNTEINADQQNPIQQIVQLYANSVFYSYYTREILNIYLGTYIIETQTSFWPFSNAKQIKRGHYIAKKSKRVINTWGERYHEKIQLYGQIFIYMSNQKKTYYRKVGKIDVVIAYIGGLLGLIFTLFSYCITSYNKYSYELIVAETSFNHDKSMSKMKESKFHFFNYLKYQIFSIFKHLFFIQLNWKNSKKIKQSKKQANSLLDVKYLLGNISYLQSLLDKSMDKNQIKLTQLCQIQSIQSVKSNRYLHQYYKYVMKQDIDVNWSDAKQNRDSYELYFRNRRKNKIKQQLTKGQNKQFPEKQQNQQSQQRNQISRKLKDNLGIQDQVLVEGISFFSEIHHQAKEVRLNKQMKRAEQLLVEAYLDLNYDDKIQILNKIPFKIIHRFCLYIENQKIIGQKNKQLQIKDL